MQLCIIRCRRRRRHRRRPILNMFLAVRPVHTPLPANQQ